MSITRVLGFLAMLIGFAHCFSWDIVVAGNKQLNFYSNGMHTHTEEIAAATKIASITYDPIGYRLLFINENHLNTTMSIYDLTTGKIQTVYKVKSTVTELEVIAYEPVTQLLFIKNGSNIYSFSLNSASAKIAKYGNLVVKSDNYVRDIAVDSCGGYIYWITDRNIEKARFDGSQREVIIDSTVIFRRSLAVDQQTQKMYWIDCKLEKSVYYMSIESADLNGNNRKRLHISVNLASSIAVSKDFIYWQDNSNEGIWQLPNLECSRTSTKKIRYASWHKLLALSTCSC
ncbi:hypothetical protein PYW08_014279 [Mythimna loreyi]|uniref:Uncharacterized protein n=1 Tax=Mythimna loreyi TaxID=667449 RepID=A0ACC2R6X6_9NEOP|nr:hypothetical protein PYW08_014279 [Mythimna loreyi]